MAATKSLPAQRPGNIYLTEGGIETEIMYKWGFELPQFAMFPLLDNPVAVSAMQGMYRRFLDVAARHQTSVLMGSLDYRASPDWGALWTVPPGSSLGPPWLRRLKQLMLKLTAPLSSTPSIALTHQNLNRPSHRAPGLTESAAFARMSQKWRKSPCASWVISKKGTPSNWDN